MGARMSFQASAWATKQRTGSPSGKALLMAIANYAGEFGECHPAISTLAEDSEQSEASVRRRLHEFVELGLVARFERSRENGSCTSNEFVLLFCDKAKDYARKLGWDDTALSNCKGGALSNCKEGAFTGERGTLSLVTGPEQSMNNQSNLPPTPQGARETEQGLCDEGEASSEAATLVTFESFEAVWRPWTQNESRSDALAAWRRLKPHEREAAVKNAASFVAGQALRRNPTHAKTYLDQRRWAFPADAATQPKREAGSAATGAKVAARQKPDGSWWLAPDSPQLQRWHE